MGFAGTCCDNLEEPLALMKMGLNVILVGHVNFLLGALVHGIVLRQINLHEKARGMGYAISNVVALLSGVLTWSLFSISLVSSLMAGGSTIGLFVSLVKTIVNGGRVLLTHCRLPDAIGFSSVTNECPFDPTRVYSTTIFLWAGLIVSCSIQMVFSARCLAACVSFLGLSGCRKSMRHKKTYTRPINVAKETSQPYYTEPPRRQHNTSQVYTEPPRVHNVSPRRHTEKPRYHKERSQLHTNPPGDHSKPTRHHKDPPRSNNKPSRHPTAPPRLERHTPQRPLPSHNQSLPTSERQPLRQSHRDRSDVERQEMRSCSQQRGQGEHHNLRRGTSDRSSIWI
ncbi:keratinocyte-associated protein 3-like isoform X2 [Gambusia affinis]|uniref:keratinocyte-associated protein 3-like isoform X2 n=1 Tax=Gambusia affinis TaxID=33528 RepID=UPI001CDCEED4|nr:keratinocyte-associated protein 3-like isoform X2 [Gambusia affinis]